MRRQRGALKHLQDPVGVKLGHAGRHSFMQAPIHMCNIPGIPHCTQTRTITLPLTGHPPTRATPTCHPPRQAPLHPSTHAHSTHPSGHPLSGTSGGHPPASPTPWVPPRVSPLPSAGPTCRRRRSVSRRPERRRRPGAPRRRSPWCCRRRPPRVAPAQPPRSPARALPASRRRRRL